MAKYLVTAPLAYARRTGEPSNGLGIRREIVRHEVGDIVELDDVVAAKFPRKLEWYAEPANVEKRRPPKTKAATYGHVDVSREDVDFSNPSVREQVVTDLAEQYKSHSGDE